jgi:hypothetical protein
MRPALVLLASLLAFPAGAAAASFTTPPYEGATYSSGAGPFEWGMISSHPTSDELGGVSVEVNPGKHVDRCLPPGTLRLSGLQEGTTYTVTIADDYSPAWLTEHNLTVGQQCAASTPAGGNARSDSVTIAGSAPLPLPINTVAPFQDEAPPGAAEDAALASARAVAAFEAERAAHEAQAFLRTQQPAAPKLTAPSCIVPSLVGHSLVAARRLLAAAHCRLGRVAAPAQRHAMTTVVRQHPGHGAKLPIGTTVSVALAAKHR